MYEKDQMIKVQYADEQTQYNGHKDAFMQV